MAAQMLHRTVDVVWYKENSIPLYIGGKDTQIKLKGQRLHVCEFEKQILAGVHDEAGDVVPKEMSSVWTCDD